MADFHLPQAIDNSITLVRERAARRAITLEVGIDPRLGEIKGDERKVKQVLLNLLSNAIKFTPEGGRVGVQAGLADGFAEISVTDTGVGIAPEDHGRLPRRQRSGRSGSENVKVEPWPTWLFTQMRPPCSSTNFRASVRPRPVPSRLRA